MSLTILCVTKYEDCTDWLRLQIDDLARDVGADMVWYDGRHATYIEQVLDDAVASCPDGHILRLDDDERCGDDMRDWLRARGYEGRDHWCFRRAHLWPDTRHYITDGPLWPDVQTRLSVKAKSGRRTIIHQGSPFGSGWLAEPIIEHHKFLIRTDKERQQLVNRYEAGGASEQFRVFSFPELVGDIHTEPVPTYAHAV